MADAADQATLPAASVRDVLTLLGQDPAKDRLVIEPPPGVDPASPGFDVFRQVCDLVRAAAEDVVRIRLGDGYVQVTSRRPGQPGEDYDTTTYEVVDA